MSYPSPFKRLLSSLYDSLLVLAVLFIAMAITLPFTSSEAVKPGNLLMSIYELLVIFLFYGWFWTHGGQTLGMRAWKIKLESLSGANASWQQCFIRYLSALPAWCVFLAGLLLWMLPDKISLPDMLSSLPEWLITLTGFIWLILDNRGNNWRDKLSGTHIITVNKDTAT